MAIDDFIKVTRKSISTTEASHTMQTDTLAVEMQSLGVDTLVGFETGFLAGGGGYRTVKDGYSWAMQNRNWAGATIYLDTSSGSGTLEITEIRKLAS